MEPPAAADPARQADQTLGQAVERAYDVFAGNHLGASMVVHRRDVTPAEVSALSGPVRSVAASAVDRWLPHAVTTWGTADDVRALLPRVLELLTAGLLTSPAEVLFSKLRQADAAEWPAEERAALSEVITALWGSTLSRHPSPIGLPAGRLLTALAELGQPILPFLDVWMARLTSGPPSDAPARLHLLDLDRRVKALQATGFGVSDLFWSPHPTDVGLLEMWLSSPLARSELRR